MRKDCVHCGKVYKKVSSLQVHMQSIHENIRRKCPDCHKTYCSQSAVNRHRHTKHISNSTEVGESECTTVQPNDDKTTTFQPHKIYPSISVTRREKRMKAYSCCNQLIVEMRSFGNEKIQNIMIKFIKTTLEFFHQIKNCVIIRYILKSLNVFFHPKKSFIIIGKFL